MRTQELELKPNLIGHVNDNEALTLTLDVTDIIEDYGSGTFSCTFQRSQDANAYVIPFAQISVADNILKIKLTSAEMQYSGTAKLQIMYTVGTTIVMSRVYSLVINSSLASGATPPQPFQVWVADIYEALKHEPVIGLNGNWYIWDNTESRYEDSGTLAKGQGVPTGGTTGQVLKKKSNTDYDTEWTTGGGEAVWGGITGTLSNQTDLNTALNSKQGTLTAGSNIQINNNTISATDTTYTAGTYIDITDNVISSTVPPEVAVQSTEPSSSYKIWIDTDEQAADVYTKSETDALLAEKQDELTAGSNITISNDVISATDTTYSDATTSVSGLMSSTDKTKLDGISSNAKNVSVSSTGTATDEVQYITIDGTEKKLAGGGGSSYPDPPSTTGTYSLIATVNGTTTVYSWNAISSVWELPTVISNDMRLHQAAVINKINNDLEVF